MSLRARLVLAIAATTVLSLIGCVAGLQYAAANVSNGRTLAWSTVVAVVVALAWSVLVTSWIVDGFTAEQRAIARIVRDFAAGDHGMRVDLRSRDPETEHLARDLDAMMEQLSRLMDAQRRFAANAAHELRSPLTTLHGELALALRRERSAEDYRTAIAHALEAATDLRALAEDLLDLARASSRDFPRERRDVDVAAVVRRVAEGRAVVTNRGSEPLLVTGDERDIERLVSNLIDNAQRHSAGKIVTVDAQRLLDVIEIAVEDDGVGLDASRAEHIFEPFERGDASGGTGLGLSICRHIAITHSGSIHLDTTRVRGCRFVVTLPRAAGPSRSGQANR